LTALPDESSDELVEPFAPGTPLLPRSAWVFPGKTILCPAISLGVCAELVRRDAKLHYIPWIRFFVTNM